MIRGDISWLPPLPLALSGLRTLQLHLPELERKPEPHRPRPIAHTRGVAVTVIGIGVYGRVAVPVEEVVHIDPHRDAPLPELRPQPEVDAVARPHRGEQEHVLRLIVGGGVHLQHFPQLRPKVQPETVTQIFRRVGLLLVAELERRLRVIDIAVKPDVHKALELVRNIHLRTRVQGSARVDGPREIDNPSEKRIVTDIRKAGKLVFRVLEPRIDAHVAELVDILRPARLHGVGERLSQVGVSRTEAVLPVSAVGGQVGGLRIVHPPRVTQLEIVHVLRAVAQVYRREKPPIEFPYVIGRGIGIV